MMCFFVLAMTTFILFLFSKLLGKSLQFYYIPLDDFDSTSNTIMFISAFIPNFKPIISTFNTMFFVVFAIVSSFCLIHFHLL